MTRLDDWLALRAVGGAAGGQAARSALAYPPSALAGVHLQWFAQDDESKTEDPTEHKKRKAREEGRVPKSQDLTAGIGLILTMGTLAMFGPYMLANLRQMLRWFLEVSVELDITRDGGPIVSVFFYYFLRIMLPVVSVAFVAAIVSNLLQVGFLFTTKPIRPDFKKIVPKFGQFFKRMLFSAEGAFNLIKSIFKVCLIGVIVFVNINGAVPELIRLFTSPLWNSFTYIASLAMRIIFQCTLLLLAIAIPDYLFQRFQFNKQLMMTKQEVKEEHKMMEGDPLVKGRLRRRMQEIAARNMIANVPKADVVITNPTHYAVALEWNRQRMAAPVVSAKGLDEVAQRIKTIARESRVPIVENRPLARALYAESELGDPIPEKFYEAVATVLAHVSKADARARARYLGQAQSAQPGFPPPASASQPGAAASR
ncbi:MAG: flagellar biosynthesis protein FlhB [Spirochaetes bacterium GWD1_61_31]|nr:MAG: flagellar biosynthesis protein FlhB [Spirochaetes bacterium GWB1_60_80]OHD28528.1 MAG: flagellar biosynthesis protein FlhB [Spirochaetes bacterium GWC1_61_12]OHD42191.1 MAG: flagellar biosynthesis protein FlhB [Spirochaetes bacterium GWD1_61_31]OHD44521.1 MAG: flagellar biosynthesis protein FlhB [Spirochaetes bacterium GWE1_60_18]OHD59327.1 MAG: flagellar biosynthesis protein FlhB [Spirochaetes bacterium GWF1_60_12]